MYEKISYAGVDELNLFLQDEFKRYNLINAKNLENYAQNIIKNIENLTQEKQVKNLKDENLIFFEKPLK
ncbi:MULTISPECIES: hypothetical protein [unclassified Campylobacter]|uniref:hypothetical protein n=1 Tax=unclassified Campylobacter TaxID=2593542 RepID=UPI001CC1CBA8|nr:MULTISPECIES: hypothetical protein [unclassified Campylobacter]